MKNRRIPENLGFEDAAKEQRELALLESLKKIGATIKDDPLRVRGACLVQFQFEDARATIRIGLDDSSGADLVIANTTIRPEQKRGEGLGSQAVQRLLAWAVEHGLHNIRAVQVGDNSETFWEKNGFVKDEAASQTNDFVYRPQVTPQRTEL